jgi:hypothetical protein
MVFGLGNLVLVLSKRPKRPGTRLLDAIIDKKELV